MAYSAEDADAQATLNIPHLLALCVLSFFVIRWWFSSPPSASSSSSSSSSSGNPTVGRGGVGFTGRRVDENAVQQILSMFPQVQRRDVLWDLQRNGGSVAATAERVLTRGSLDTAPPSFQPPPPPTTPTNASSASTPRPTSSSTSSTPSKASYPDLITRYNLGNKVGMSTAAEEPEVASTTGASRAGGKQGWSANKSERQALLQRRREEMILQARRKLEEKERAAKGAAGS